jgi:aromatic ring-opening dioxygenase catalytic subunit (LigB family)
MVVISGHWEEPEFSLTGAARPPLIYDYSGFPPHTYQLTYPAPGSPELAERVGVLLREAGIPARTDATRGFDHGVFIPFKVVYPEAQIPIVQLSLHAGLDPAVHLAAGRALQPLREEGILIAGSGMSYHNMRGFFSGRALPGSDQFDAWLSEAVTAEPHLRDAQLQKWQSAPSAREAHPREEHLIPLMVAAGAAGEDRGVKTFSDRVMGATVSAYRFG